MNKWHLRFVVTSNCNFNCKYCNNNENKQKELDEDEIKKILEASNNIGIKKIHWTGGEPLVRKNIIEYIKYAKKIGFQEQSITTNGFLLNKKAEELLAAGIDRFNVSLDTMNKEKFKEITGREGLDNVIDGINKVLEKSDSKIKINMVVMKDNLDEILKFIEFAKDINKNYNKERIIIRFLQFFPCNPNQLQEEGQNYWKGQYVTEEEIINKIKEKNKIKEISNKEINGNNPTIKYYEVDEKLKIGILAMFSWNYPCGNCYKLRITPYGYASCCLNDDKMFKLIDLDVSEKEKILKEVIERRCNVIEKDKDRKHYRKKLGEVRFGKKGKEIELNDFYKIIDIQKKG